MATIEKRDPNQWRAKIRRKGYPSQTKTFDRKSDAESWVREIESEMDRGAFVSRAEAEGATLHWVQVDLKKRSLYLSKTKNSEPRTVPLSPAAIQILSALPRNIHGSVFNMTADAITKAMRRATAQAKIPNLTFHDLRHEATSRLFENTDLDAMEIAEITGHKTMQMLKRYSHLRTNRLVDRLAGAIRGSLLPPEL